MIGIEREGDRRLRLSGELDFSEVDRLNEALGPELEGGGPLTLDVSELTFMDSSGLRALLQAASALRDRGGLALVSPTPAVRRLLEVSGVSDFPGLEIREEGSGGP